MDLDIKKMKPKTDICLLLEGTYPYVTGGVSSWVHQLISSLQEFTFSLVVILPNKNFSQEAKYPVTIAISIRMSK